MKKSILTIMFVMLAVLTINGQDYGDQYYDDRGYGYDSSVANQEYYYDYENILPVIGRYSAVYFWAHPYKYVNFVIVGDRVYIIPRDIFFRIYHRGRFFSVSMERFISLSCFGMSYYDNYYRFSLYSDYYRYNYYSGRRYGSSWLAGLRSHYRNQYRNRRYNKKYSSLRNRYFTGKGVRQNHGSKYRSSRNPRIHLDGVYNSRGVTGRSYSSKRTGYNSYNPGKSRRTTERFSGRSGQQRGNNTYRSSKRSGSSVRGYSGRSTGGSDNRGIRKSSSGRNSTSKRSISKTRSSDRRSHTGRK